ncbi:hypothetical protein U4E84_05600 [Halorubrum sp. AD140]|uniref:hypothetical protein n=1 Tax=Halorubrum sp. AD140 TaxID=3050073 RepID=UPI002ACCA773|nr:hypothetical protein [Halorubrum sp. AD140]MDZ5810818.1 hypothetical protein [Halorubrum sp. AD140]
MNPDVEQGYRLHCVLSNLNWIETAGLDDADQERNEAARILLQNVSLLSHPQHSGDVDTQVES